MASSREKLDEDSQGIVFDTTFLYKGVMSTASEQTDAGQKRLPQIYRY
jgi:hypothetical protein